MPKPIAGTGIASAPRTKLKLAKVVRSKLESLGLPGQTRKKRKGEK